MKIKIVRCRNATLNIPMLTNSLFLPMIFGLPILIGYLEPFILFFYNYIGILIALAIDFKNVKNYSKKLKYGKWLSSLLITCAFETNTILYI